MDEILSAELSAEEQSTALKLRQLLGPAMSDRYVDICRLATGAFELRVAAPLAGHAIREFDSTLRTILAVPMDAQPEGAALEELRVTQGIRKLQEMGFDEEAIRRAEEALQPRLIHKEQIKKIVGSFGLSEDGDIANAWFALLKAHGKTHKRSFTKALSVDDEFRETFLQPFHTVVRAITIALEKRYTPLVARVTEIAEMDDKDHATKLYAREIAGALPLQWHFFRKLETKDWLPFLISRKLLGEPMPGYKEDKELKLPMAQWPAGDYLKRMAKDGDRETRNMVVEALKAVADSKHSDVQSMGMEIFGALPPEEAAPHVDIVVGWLTPNAGMWHTHFATPFLVSLSKAGQKEAGLKVARALLQVWEVNGEVANLFGQHMYEHHLPKIREAMAGNFSEETYQLLLDILEKASAIGGWDEYMHYSRRPFMDNPNPSDGVFGALATAVATTASEIMAADPTKTESIVRNLASRSGRVYTRMALHILSKNPSAAPELAGQYLANPDLIGTAWCNIEYAELANAWFPSMSTEEQSRLLDLVSASAAEGKELWIPRFEQHKGHPPTVSDHKAYEDTGFRDAVWSWQDVLPGDVKDRLRDIVAEHGDPHSWQRRIYESAESPLDASEFVSRPFAEIAEYLKKWRPAEGEQKQTITALAQALRQAVMLNPEKFAADADLLIGAAPIFFRRAFEGMHNAASSEGKPSFSWAKILKLIEHCFEQFKFSDNTAGESEGDDISWGWACKAAADLLCTGLGRGAGIIDFAHSAEIQSLVLKFHALVPVGPEEEDFEERFARDPYFTAQNSMRGAAVDLCVLSMFWLSKDISSPIGANGSSVIKNLPELRKLMEIEIGDKTSNGRIPRAILGRFLTWLAYFGLEWLETQMNDIMPPDNELLCDAFWAGHLGNDYRPVPKLMAQMHTSYMKEITGTGVVPGRGKRFDNRLGEYIIDLQLQGALPEDILHAFWEHAPESTLRHCMWLLGRTLLQPSYDMPTETRDRGRSYWLSRLEAATAASDPETFSGEIGTFGQWCEGTENAEWLVEQLCAMLAAGFAPNHSYGIIEWLAEIFSAHPEKAVQALHGIISNPKSDQWSYLTTEPSLRIILGGGLKNGSDEIKRLVNEVISILLAKGQTQYAALLKAN